MDNEFVNPNDYFDIDGFIKAIEINYNAKKAQRLRR